MAVEPLAEGYLLHATQRTAAPARRRALSLRFLGDHPSVLLDGTLVGGASLKPDSFELERRFEPEMKLADADRLHAGWLRAVERVRDWEEH